MNKKHYILMINNLLGRPNIYMFISILLYLFFIIAIQNLSNLDFFTWSW